MSINEPEELAGMRAAGAVVRLMLQAMKDAVRPGITTAELDEVGAGVMRQHGAKSAPAMVYGFPGVSWNDNAWTDSAWKEQGKINAEPAVSAERTTTTQSRPGSRAHSAPGDLQESAGSIRIRPAPRIEHKSQCIPFSSDRD